MEDRRAPCNSVRALWRTTQFQFGDKWVHFRIMRRSRCYDCCVAFDSLSALRYCVTVLTGIERRVHHALGACARY